MASSRAELVRFGRQLLLITELLRDETQKLVKAPCDRDPLAEAIAVRGACYAHRNVADVLSLARSLDAIAVAILQETGAIDSPVPPPLDAR